MRSHNRRSTKRTCEHLHAKRRAKERYGIEFNRKQHDEIVALIRSGRFILKQEQSARIRIYDIVYMQQDMRIVYDKKRGQVVSFLPFV